jgi:hypothetical protein
VSVRRQCELLLLLLLLGVVGSVVVTGGGFVSVGPGIDVEFGSLVIGVSLGCGWFACGGQSYGLSYSPDMVFPPLVN